MIIAKVWHAKANNTNMITVPKHSGLKAGDYVKLIRVQTKLDDLVINEDKYV